LVFYSDWSRYDGGFRIDRNLNYLIDKYKSGSTGVEVPQFGSFTKWIRKECLDGLQCNMSHARLPQIEVTFMLWVKDYLYCNKLCERVAACRIPKLICDPTGVEKN